MYQILGSNKKLRKGDTGLCFSGNPVPIKRKEEIEEFKDKYIVTIKYSGGTKYFQVIKGQKQIKK